MAVNETTNILGQGWSFPLHLNSRSGIALTGDEADIRESISIILGTAKGERHMRPNFGCGIHDLVFASYDANTSGQIIQTVEEALGWWEPRIEVLDVSASQDERNGEKILINIQYRIKSTNDVRNLVYPFFLTG